MTYIKLSGFVIIIIFLSSSGCSNKNTGSDPALLSWEEIVDQAKGGNLTMMMWKGDPLINQYMNEYVIPEINQRYSIDLTVVNGQGTQVVSTLMSELESGQLGSQIDMMWINGETFYQLRQIDALYGPFTNKLPNTQYVDFQNPFIGIDFQQPVEGYEAPWGNVQLTLIYNPEQVQNPPQNLNELEQWVKQHPEKFTIPTEFTGMTFLKSLMISMADKPERFHGAFSEEVYQHYSSELWERINTIKPYFWRGGETFPNSIAQMHQLFSNGEIVFTMSNNDNEVDNKIAQGLFPDNTRAYVPKSGTIQNSHYLGISKHSANKTEALVVINFLMSPEAQFEKMKPDVWGDGTVLAIDRLPAEWRQRFDDMPGRTKAPDRSKINDYALMEPAPEYMIRIFDDFRSEVVN